MQQFDGTSKLIDARTGLWIVATGLPTSRVSVKIKCGAGTGLGNLPIRTCSALWRTILHVCGTRLVNTSLERPEISIIIPAYNESARISNALTEVVSCVRERAWRAEILVVNDGSTDRTVDIVQEFSQQNPEVRLLDNFRNRGKGYSVRNGMLHAVGDMVMFTDADLSAPMQEAELLFDALRDGADIAIGSRWLERGRQTVKQPLYRQFFGRCFNSITRIVMGLPFADTQCGFKAFRRPVAHTIFQLQRIERWGFDPELLFIAIKRGFTVREVPVTWGHDERSRLSYLKDGINMLEEIAYVRWEAFAGAYDRKVGEFTPEWPTVKG
jgi:glycosyltransferase involved in cell wall biosynthesis